MGDTGKLQIDGNKEFGASFADGSFYVENIDCG
jgi:hypothetical protein